MAKENKGGSSHKIENIKYNNDVIFGFSTEVEDMLEDTPY